MSTGNKRDFISFSINLKDSGPVRRKTFSRTARKVFLTGNKLNLNLIRWSDAFSLKRVGGKFMHIPG
jgi:hypothetical protein